MKTHKIIINHKRHVLDELVYHFEADTKLEALIKYLNYDSRGTIKIPNEVLVNEETLIEWIDLNSNGDVKVISVTVV